MCGIIDHHCLNFLFIIVRPIYGTYVDAAADRLPYYRQNKQYMNDQIIIQQLYSKNI